MSAYDDCTIVESYVFWRWFFKAPEMMKNKGKLEGYTFPSSYDVYREKVLSVNGVCPICRGDKALSFTEKQIIGDYSFKDTYCLCTLLENLKASPLEGSSAKPALLSTINPIDKPAGAGKFTKIILKDAQDFIDRLGTWRFLIGGYGSGKTHILRAIKTQLGDFALYLTSSDLNQMVIDSVGAHAVSELIWDISNAHVLLIDDFGADYPSPFYSSVLYAIFNNRYEMGTDAPTYFTSNTRPVDMMSSSDDNRKRLGSRLQDVSLIIHLATSQIDWRSHNG